MANTKKDTQTTTTLLELCRKKDSNAWDRLTKLYKKLVLYWLKEYKVPSEASDEVYQGILLKLSEQFRTFRKGPTGKFRNWLRKMAFSCAMDFHTSKGESPVDKKLDVENISAEQEQQELAIINRQLIASLKDRCNPVHINVYELVIKGMKSREIAEKLGLSGTNVRQITCRIRKLIHSDWDGLL